jgi:hypothetical protein
MGAILTQYERVCPFRIFPLTRSVGVAAKYLMSRDVLGEDAQAPFSIRARVNAG